MMPKAMPVVMEYVRTIIRMTAMTVMTVGMSSQSISFRFAIIAAPTTIIAPTVQL